ncbi:MAG: STAS domain-containing protein [Candidatus Kapabacteria bacterium]|nr:STAS domain-containing protein [Candidatus Kapabacteria bacterium]
MEAQITSTSNNVPIAMIKLEKQILGGTEALLFSSKMRELVAMKIGSVVIDLSSVESMNSSGLGMLVSGLSTLKNAGSNMLLANVPEKVMNLLTMTHLDKILKIFSNVDEAVSSLN